MSLPTVKLDQGIHVMHLFYTIDRDLWADLSEGVAAEAQEKLNAILEANRGPCEPRVDLYATCGPKADLAFMVYAADLGAAMQLHRDIENCFPAGALECVYDYFSITELSEYATTEEDTKAMLVHQEKLDPESDEFKERFETFRKKIKEYEHYRLYPEMPEWEVMCFYPMLKRRQGEDNWYSLDFEARKKLMKGHATVGRKYAGRVSQLITSSTGLDEWEWGVTLMAHQVDAVRDIVYEMRFDEVTARYGGFGPFYVNMRVTTEQLWEHLRL